MMNSDSRVIAFVIRLVEASHRHAASLSIPILATVAVIGFVAARHIGIDTDTDKLFSPNLPWRRAAMEMDRAFPQNADLLAIVIDGATPDQAEDAAAILAQRLAASGDLFRDVREPDGGMFFRRNGLLFLAREDVQKFADEMITAQPMIGTLAADPSPRGVFNALDLFAQGPLHGEADMDALDRPFRAVAEAVTVTLDGRYQPLSWQNLLSDRKPLPRELRRFVLARPTLNYDAVEPGRRAIEAVHAAAQAEGFVAARGVRVRVTGSVALSDDQLSALEEGSGFAAAGAFGLLLFWLLLAVRSLRAVAALLITLAAGLVACVGFAVAAVGRFNPLSVAFAPLFIGIAIDFGIQFSGRYAAERATSANSADAFRRTAAGLGLPLVVAGAATAVGFLSLVPSGYRGVSDLGLIAGAGMLIALALNLTLLPALLGLFRTGGFKEAGGFVRAEPLDRILIRRRGWVMAAAGVAAVASAAALPRLHFDFDPINLENPRAESVQTLFDLMKSPDTTPYTIDVLTDASAAAEQARRLGSLPEVSRAIWIGSFIPEDQPAKLDILADAQNLLAPTLAPLSVKPAPSAREILDAASRCADDAGKLAARGDRAAAELAGALRRAADRGEQIVPLLDANLSQGIPRRLEDMRLALQASAVSLETIPSELKQDWVATDGRYRIQVFPKGDARDPGVLRRFVAAVRREAPYAAGMPVGIQESARTVIQSFAIAGWIATGAITLLLALVLRNIRDVAAVLAPLLLAGLFTLATSAAAGIALNFANIVTLPLLLGIGVAFDIYFVMRWRGGEPHLLRSPTARAVVFSALTTGTAFGSLALSKSPGMADMGKLLSIGLFFTLVCTLFVLPALLGPAPNLPQTMDRA
jgi:hopanoid biosynthesis associated RND transporter like protein HpnN